MLRSTVLAHSSPTAALSRLASAAPSWRSAADTHRAVLLVLLPPDTGPALLLPLPPPLLFDLASNDGDDSNDRFLASADERLALEVVVVAVVVATWTSFIRGHTDSHAGLSSCKHSARGAGAGAARQLRIGTASLAPRATWSANGVNADDDNGTDDEEDAPSPPLLKSSHGHAGIVATSRTRSSA